MQSITWSKPMKFTEKMCRTWSIVTFQQKEKPMSQYEFKVHMEFCGYRTDREPVEKFYNIYLDELEKQKSK